MSFKVSSTGIYHMVFGAVGSKGLFLDREDYKEFMKILRLYKDHLGVKLLGYALTPRVVHLVIQCEGGGPEAFAAVVKRTYSDYYYRRYFSRELFHHQSRIRAVTFYRDFMELYRYLHKQGINSLKRFERYGAEKKDPYLDAEYVFSAFGNNLAQGKRELEKISVMENQEDYAVQMKSLEFFPEDKRTLRVKRAREFLDRYLAEKGITLHELDLEDYREEKLRLVRSFREKTDLSYRDIGQTLGASHTTVIRLYKEAHERDFRRSIRRQSAADAQGFDPGEALLPSLGSLDHGQA